MQEDGFNKEEFSEGKGAIQSGEVYDKVKASGGQEGMYFIESDELYDAADFFIETMQYDKALEVIDYADAMYGHDTDFLLLRAEALIFKEKYQEAMLLLDEAEKEEPDLARVYVLRANIYRKNGEEHRVLREYRRAFDNGITEPDVIYEEMGFYYLESEQIPESVKSFGKSIEYNPENENIHRVLVHLYFEFGMVADGLLFYEKFTGTYPECKFAWNAAGHLFEHEDMTDKAVKAYEKALRIDDSYMEAIVNIFRCLKLKGDFQRVIKVCLHYGERNFPFFKSELAMTYYETDRIEEALAVYNEIYDKAHTNLDAIIGISNCYAFDGQYKKALNFIDKAIGQNEHIEEILFHKALLLIDSSDKQGALDVLLHLINEGEYALENCDVYFEAALIYSEFEQYKEAAALLVKALEECNFYTPDILYLLAASYYNDADYEKAYSYFEDALQAGNSHFGVFYDNCPKAENDMLIIELIQKYTSTN